MRESKKKKKNQRRNNSLLMVSISSTQVKVHMSVEILVYEKVTSMTSNSGEERIQEVN